MPCLAIREPSQGRLKLEFGPRCAGFYAGGGLSLEFPELSRTAFCLSRAERNGCGTVSGLGGVFVVMLFAMNLAAKTTIQFRVAMMKRVAVK